MQIGKFYSRPPHNFFAPKWEYYIGMVNAEHPEFVEAFKQLILKKEKEILAQFPDKGQDAGTLTGVDSLTAKYRFYNIFAWQEPEAVAFRQFVVDQYKEFLREFGLAIPPTWGRCWANVLHKGGKIAIHNHGCHSYSYLSGHFVLAAKDTATYYENPVDLSPHREENVPGTLTFFPSYIRHWTDANEQDTPRITLAFDMYIADEEFRKNNFYGYFREENDAPEVQLV